MIRKYGLMLRLPLFLLVSLAMLTAGLSFAEKSPPTTTEKDKVVVCMNQKHIIIDGKCMGSKKMSRPQLDRNETGDFGQHPDYDMTNDGYVE